jgi:hypothetical protein
VTYVSSAQDLTALPSFGTHELTTGFSPDPIPIRFRVRGNTAAATALGIRDPTGGVCTGYINPEQPSVRLFFLAGTSFPLRFFFESAVDTTLCVNLPDTT